jgi:hypothetical protein
MVVGILMLLFIGSNRLWHFVYIRLDAMVCGFFQLPRLPAASTFWRYVDSLGSNQAKSILKVSSALRERVWHLCGLKYRRIHLSIDTTAETVYGNQQGGRLGYNTAHRGKKAYRALCWALSMKPGSAFWANSGREMFWTEGNALFSSVKSKTICPGV